MLKWLKRLRWTMTVEGIAEAREAHKRILISSCGGANVTGKKKMQIAHVDKETGEVTE